jgi:hypothetical protein
MENKGQFTPCQNTDIISKLLIADFMLVDTLGLLYFVFQKWNYLNTDLYEKDMDTLLAQLLVTKQKINDKFQLDCFLGGGWHQGFTRDTV